MDRYDDNLCYVPIKRLATATSDLTLVAVAGPSHPPYYYSHFFLFSLVLIYGIISHGKFLFINNTWATALIFQSHALMLHLMDYLIYISPPPLLSPIHYYTPFFLIRNNQFDPA